LNDVTIKLLKTCIILLKSKAFNILKSTPELYNGVVSGNNRADGAIMKSGVSVEMQKQILSLYKSIRKERRS
jgi:hypothetical protein